MTLRSRHLHLGLALVGMLSLLAGQGYWTGIIPGLLALAGLIVLPGSFLLLMLRPTQLSWNHCALFAGGLSVIMLILVGLLTNTFGPALGILRPLAPEVLGPVFAVLLTAMATLSAWINRGHSYQFSRPSLSRLNIAFGLVFASLPVLSAMGAVSLNNGGGNSFTLIMYALIAVAASSLIALRQHIATSTWTWAVFTSALALLWSTSLRGWHITGHDLQLEYYVFQLTDAAQYWTLSAFHDPYNACLSITILPVVLKALSSLDITVLYKVIYPLLFAASATGVLALARRYATAPVAFLAAWTFITFPTFMIDFPMLARQEIAFGFFILLLITLFGIRVTMPVRYTLAILFGIGIVLSHYSTTFVTVALLIGVYALHIPHALWQAWVNRRNHDAPSMQPPIITLGVVLSVLIGAIIWTGLITRTGDNIRHTATKVVTSISGKLTGQEDSQKESSNTGYSLVKGQQASPTEQLQDYITSRRAESAAVAAQTGGFYANASQYPVTLTEEPKQALTSVGQWLKHLGLEPSRLSGVSKQLYALTLQGLIVIGAILVLWYCNRLKIHPDYAILTALGLGLVGVQVLMPVIDYGLLRLLQQMMTFLALPAILAALWGLKKLRFNSRNLRLQVIAGLLGIGFIATSGLTGQITGGTAAPLQLANSGFYYDAYYTSEADIAATDWLDRHYPAGYPIYADMFTRMKVLANTGITTHDGIVPAALPHQSYVVLAGPNVTANRVALYHHGELLFYQYPDKFLDDNKDLIYSTNQHRVYR